MGSLFRILKLAEAMMNNNENLEQLCVHADAYIKRHAHFAPENDGTTPNPWKSNMDYSSYENSPYYGSVSEFMRKFPGGIKDWLKWRKESQKERNLMFSKPTKKAEIEVEDLTEKYIPTAKDIEESKAPATKEQKQKAKDLVFDIIEDLLESGEISSKEVKDYIDKHYEKISAAHFIPEGGDDVSKFEKELHLFSGEMGKFKDIQDYINKWHKHMKRESDADDSALKAARDFVEYYKLLLKGKAKRKSKK
jgi:hypothetical protein